MSDLDLRTAVAVPHEDILGGGKTHTLIALLHLVRNRDALDSEGLIDGFPDPGEGRVAVLPCLDLDAAGGRQVGGIRVRTLWGELAMRVGGPEACEIVREADQLRVNPGGNLLRKVPVQVPGLPGDVLDVALQGLTDTLLYDPEPPPFIGIEEPENFLGLAQGEPVPVAGLPLRLEPVPVYLIWTEQPEDG